MHHQRLCTADAIGDIHCVDRGLEQERLRYSPAEFPELYQKWVTFEDAGREVFLMERLP